MNHIDQFSFGLAGFNRAIDITHNFKAKNITHYVYMFSTTFGETIKYGISSDREWRYGTFGNRIYKQALGAPGWPNRNCNGDSSAKEFANLLEIHFPNITKNDIIVSIFDVATPQFLKNDATTRKLILESEELDLLQKYEKKYKSLPPGNIQSLRNRGHMKSYSSLFEVDDT
tara:strand:+ start:1276 stop:1791 length:516 start_codon:yes stop_codon:yes gene_type:complete